MYIYICWQLVVYMYTCLAGVNVLVLSQLQGKLCRFFGRSQPCYFIVFCIEGQIGLLCPTFAKCRTRTGSDSDSKAEFGSGPVILCMHVYASLIIMCTEKHKDSHDGSIHVKVRISRCFMCFEIALCDYRWPVFNKGEQCLSIVHFV